MSHSHGNETPLLTEGAYARVRHPMYRAALFAGLCSVLIHGNVAALFWAVLVGATFLLFIPIEEQQLLAARGTAYLEYRERTPYRVLRGIW
jgi:protein-S-isoprenylcysteine O-methyltransferase Ste14